MSLRDRPRQNAAKPKGRQPCLFKDCGKPNFARGYCAAHAKQIRLGQELRPLRLPRPDAAPGYHWCSHCKQFRPVEDFGWDKTRNQPKRLCLACASERQNAWVARNREQANHQRRLSKHGLTAEEYTTLEASQDGLCAICRRDRPLDIDHDHDTGKVRGLLCGPCNRGIGFLNDDVAFLQAAIDYLTR